MHTAGWEETPPPMAEEEASETEAGSQLRQGMFSGCYLHGQLQPKAVGNSGSQCGAEPQSSPIKGGGGEGAGVFIHFPHQSVVEGCSWEGVSPWPWWPVLWQKGPGRDKQVQAGGKPGVCTEWSAWET